MYQPTTHHDKKEKKFNVSMNSSQFRSGLSRIDEIDEAHIIPENVQEDNWFKKEIEWVNCILYL